MTYLANGFIELLQGTLSERVCCSAPSDFDRALDAADRGFIKLLTLILEFLNDFVAFMDGRFDILDQILFIWPKGATLQCSVKKSKRVQEILKFLCRPSHINVLALVCGIELNKRCCHLDPKRDKPRGPSRNGKRVRHGGSSGVTIHTTSIRDKIHEISETVKRALRTSSDFSA
jgi:hypothetical protein